MWPFRRNSGDDEEAKKALTDARKNLRKVQRRSSQVTEVADSLRNRQERNHFGEQLEAIFIEPWRSR